MSTRRLTSLRQHWPAVLVVAVGLCATYVVRNALSQTIHAKDSIRFNTASERVVREIRARLATYVEMLRAGAALLTLEPNLESGSFTRFVEQIDLKSRYPGFETIAFTRIDSASARAMWADPVSRAAMERARDGAAAAATGALLLPRHVDKARAHGFVIYFPVYDGGLPDSVAERGARLRGFVYAPFRPSNLFEGIWGTTRQFVAFELFDGSAAPENLLFRAPDMPSDARFTGIRQFDAYGRSWSAVIRSMPSMDDASSQELVSEIFAVGIVLTVVLTMLIALQTQAHRRVAQSEATVQQLLRSERGLREEAERVGRVKDEFLATLSHELRTPLNAIVGWSHLMSDPALPADARQKALGAVQRNAQIQAQLIDDLLDMNRISSGKIVLDMKVIDPVEVVDAAVNSVRPTAETKNVALETRIDGRVRPVRADAARLQQVLWNLLNNAMKFTPSGGRVTVELRPADGHVQMVVSDTGAGIDAAFLPHVFERFRQADASTTRQHGGLGLGLSIVKSLVELHGGSIVAASAGIGRGATFTVSLPACHRAVSGHDGDDASHTPGVRQQLEGSRILVVDDDRDARELIDVVLRGAGARVIGAESAEEALRQLAAARGGFDLILSDLGMPTVNGFELLRRVRSLPPAEGGVIPAVAVSAYARAEDCAAALAAGFQLHVSKPYEPDELIAACATAISQSAELPASRPPTA